MAKLNYKNQGWLGQPPEKTVHRYILVGDRVEECKEVVVHQFPMGDVEDPDLYAAQPLMDWQNSESGQWVMQHAVESPVWYRLIDHSSFGYQYQIRAKLMGPALTEWLLKFNK
jgi:hypothetical protein